MPEGPLGGRCAERSGGETSRRLALLGGTLTHRTPPLAYRTNREATCDALEDCNSRRLLRHHPHPAMLREASAIAAALKNGRWQIGLGATLRGILPALATAMTSGNAAKKLSALCGPAG
jgi:hypothetical protein